MKKIIIAIVIIFVAFTTEAQEKIIIGNWQLTTVVEDGKTMDGFKTVFIFSENGVLNASRSSTSKPMTVGTWTYNKKQKTIVMSSELDRDFHGEAIVIKVNKKVLVYKKSGATLSFTKLAKLDLPPKIEAEKPTLVFERENILDENGDFNYEEAESKLPWKLETIVNFLKEHNEVVYNVTHFPDEQEIDTWVESEKINYNEEAQSIDVRRYSYFQNDYIDMTEDPIWMNNLEEYEYDFMFFPKENLNLYKVVGLESLETTLGIFECTVVEGYGDFDGKIKYWMVNEKPGVFAKIVKVKDAPAPFGYTNVFILKEIK